MLQTITNLLLETTGSVTRGGWKKLSAQQIPHMLSIEFTIVSGTTLDKIRYCLIRPTACRLLQTLMQQCLNYLQHRYSFRE